MCYRTDLNRIIYQNDVNASNYSFPICIFKYLDTVTSIDQVFNGFGYIGSTVFALPGIKGLIPNGRNSDGTLKNIEFVNSSVKLCNNTVTANNMCLIIPNGANSVFDGFKYIASEEKPTSNHTLWYNPTENTCRWKTTGDFGNTPCIYIGSFNRDSGKVTSFTPKTAFHAVDYNDSSWIAAQAMPSGKYIDLTLGASGSTYTAPANGYYAIDKTAGAQHQYVNLKNTTAGMSIIQHAGNDNNYHCAGFIPVRKGDILVVNYGAKGATNYFRFIYAEGEN